VTPRTVPPAPGWSPDGHRIKAPLEYSRGSDKAWVFGALRVRDGHVLTQTTASRNTAGYLERLRAIARANPTGERSLIADNLSRHLSGPIRDGLAAHPRLHQAFIPVGAAWLNLIEGWWRVLRRAAFAGQCFANRQEIALAVRVATRQLNARASPWIWGRLPKTPRQLRRRFVYCL
jgi:transposase